MKRWTEAERARQSVRADARRRTGWTIGNVTEARVAVWLAEHLPLRGVRYQHGIGDYTIDFAWPAAHLALEVDGPMHFSPHKAAADRLRDHYLRACGWIVFHVDADRDDDGVQMGRQLARVGEVVRALFGDELERDCDDDLRALGMILVDFEPDELAEYELALDAAERRTCAAALELLVRAAP